MGRDQPTKKVSYSTSVAEQRQAGEPADASAHIRRLGMRVGPDDELTGQRAHSSLATIATAHPVAISSDMQDWPVSPVRPLGSPLGASADQQS